MIRLCFVGLACLALSLSAAAGSNKGPGYKVVGGMGMIKYVVVTPGSNKAHLGYAAKAVCGSDRVCIIKFWERENDAPRYGQMTDAQVESMYGAYNRNMNTRLDRLLVCSEGGC